jgi:SAM-dependent methyltransferase
MTTTPDVYTHGHHESVLRSHTWRTAENSAGYLLNALEPGMRVLDVGCGPGTITIDLAARVAPGHVVGVDASAEIVAQASAAAAADRAGGLHVRFEVADAYALPFPDDAFDVVHAHQVLQHLTDPVAALREMRRVARPGGIVAVRDSDYAAMTWYPQSPALDDWLALYHDVTRANRAEADAGRRLLSWVIDAGFDRDGISASAGAWCFASPGERAWWSDLWAERAVASGFAAQARDYGLADDARLERIAEAWRWWGAQDDAWFSVLHGEILARV